MTALEPIAATTLGTRRVYEGNRISLRIDSIRIGEGSTVDREIVEHPGSIVVIPFIDRGTVLLIRQWRQPAGEVLLEAPAGTREPGEDPLVTAGRELREETGHSARELIPMGGSWVAPGYSAEYTHAYMAIGLARDPLPQDAGEDIHTVEVPVADIPGLIRSGRLRDQMTIAALYTALHIFPDRLPANAI